MADLPEKMELPEPFFTKAMRWTSYPVSAVLGGVAAHVSMRNSIFSRLKKHGLLNGIVKEHEEEFRQLKAKAAIKPYDITPEMREINLQHKTRINGRMKELGFKNSWDFFKGCHDTERLEAALLFGTVGGIFLGVMLTLADNKSLQHFFSKKDKSTERQINA